MYKQLAILCTICVQVINPIAFADCQLFYDKYFPSVELNEKAKTNLATCLITNHSVVLATSSECLDEIVSYYETREILKEIMDNNPGCTTCSH